MKEAHKESNDTWQKVQYVHCPSHEDIKCLMTCYFVVVHAV